MDNTLKRLTELEEKISYQAHMLDELSDELARQGRVVDRLEVRVAALRERAAQVDDLLGEAPAADQKPPHW
jgi:SlyX protein